MKHLLLAGLVAMSGVSVFAGEKCNPADWAGLDQVAGTVVRGVDGDTIVAKLGSKQISIRFLSIDTPETHFQGHTQGYWGEVASARLKELLPAGTQIKIEFGLEKCDKYGRVLGYVWKGQQDINRQMVAEGLAANYCIFPNIVYCEDYGKLTDQNILEKKGFWSDATVQIPYEWRRITDGRPYDKFVGNLTTGDVYVPGSLDRVGVGSRIFFMKEADIQPPFHPVDVRQP